MKSDDSAGALGDLLKTFKEAGIGDCVIGRVIPIAVPHDTIDQSVANAALMLIANHPMLPNTRYQPSVMKAGNYKVTVLILVHKLDPEPPTLVN